MLVRRLNQKLDRESGHGASGSIRRDAKGNIHIRRRASDNDIF